MLDEFIGAIVPRDSRVCSLKDYHERVVQLITHQKSFQFAFAHLTIAVAEILVCYYHLARRINIELLEMIEDIINGNPRFQHRIRGR